ncbi:hypothetical protein BDN72DRAFT_860491 [Pluteus cervinus]|uniref:Uncharacterized protein n=1 Tax=Pluteus cervinus TaxID=181527 RepID=A0ACD3AIV0_9AGAR|nr:hypothetical protein BDN72DRAFT_860491 [Pluteus cervinus]
MSIPTFTLNEHVLPFGQWGFRGDAYVWMNNNSLDVYDEDGVPFRCCTIGKVQDLELKCEGYGDYEDDTMETLAEASYSLVIGPSDDTSRAKSFDDAVSAIRSIVKTIVPVGNFCGPINVEAGKTLLLFCRTVLDVHWRFKPLDVYNIDGCRLDSDCIHRAISRKDVRVVFTLVNKVTVAGKDTVFAVIDHVQLLQD